MHVHVADDQIVSIYSKVKHWADYFLMICTSRHMSHPSGATRCSLERSTALHFRV